MSHIRVVGPRAAPPLRGRSRRLHRPQARAAGTVASNVTLLRAALQTIRESLAQAEPLLARLSLLLSRMPDMPTAEKVLTRVRDAFVVHRRYAGVVCAASIDRARNGTSFQRYVVRFSTDTGYSQNESDFQRHPSVNVIATAVTAANYLQRYEFGPSDASRSSSPFNEPNKLLEQFRAVCLQAGTVRATFASYLRLTGPSYDHEGEVARSKTPPPANLLDVMRKAMHAYQPLAQAHGIEIVCDEIDLDVLPSADIAHEHAALVAENLLRNAILYGARSSSIAIHAAVDTQGALCGYVVENRGLGILPSELNRVFEPGYRNTRAARLAIGAGLGLFVVKRLIELYGGRVEITSVPLDGSGYSTRVTVLLRACGEVPALAVRESPDTASEVLLRATFKAIQQIFVQAAPFFARLEQLLAKVPHHSFVHSMLQRVQGAATRLHRYAGYVYCASAFIDRSQRKDDGLQRVYKPQTPMGFAQSEMDFEHHPLGICILLIKNDVRYIQMGCEKISLDNLDRVVLTQLLEHLFAICSHARYLEENFLGYMNLTSSRVREWMAESSVQPANLLDVVLSAIRGHRPLARVRGVEIICDEADLAASPAVSTVSRWRCADVVYSVFRNLLYNAIFYSARSSIIAVRGTRSADGALCGYEMENRGLSILPSELNRVFEPGYRGAWAARAVPGVGLGLFVVKGFVELCGGRIEISSAAIDGVDFSTRVTVLFPVFAAREPSVA
jgi:signal transduction histidine kinase